MKPVFGTFGIYRWLLASMVVMQHLGPHIFGNRAVYAFFMLSGYIVTYILDTHYLHIKNGIQRYYLNRALRIYPTYWVVLLISIPFVNIFANTTMSRAEIPTTATGWIANIAIFGLSGVTREHLVPAIILPACSLSVELTWWLLLPFIIRKTYRIAAFVFIAALYQIIMFRGGISDPEILVFSPLSAMMPFSLGTLLYFRKKWGFPDIPLKWGVFVAILLVLIFSFRLNSFFALFINATAIYYLSGICSDLLPSSIARIDNVLGNIAYPVFLLHIFCGGWLNSLFPQLPTRTWSLYFSGLLASNMLATIFYYGIEYPINYLRRRVKKADI